MSTDQKFVIVGAGLAGAKAAAALHSEGCDGQIILIGDESERPYDRPPLSKSYLQGESEKDKIYVNPPNWYAEHGIDLRLDTRVDSINLQAHTVAVAGGESIGYDKLLLATGSSPRQLDVPGSELDGVLYLRNVADSDAMKTAFSVAQHVAIIGGGWIGLETAAAARAAGCAVTVLERGELPLLKVLGREVAEIYAAVHRDNGVELRTDVEVVEIIGSNSRVSGVRLGDGSVVDADAVVVGIGIVPNTSLADAAGLKVDNGIVVDEHLITSDPDVFAAGDVANCYYPHYRTHLRLEHWSAALNQGPAAATNMMGRSVAYDHVPYFYSDQYEMGMEYWGYVAPGEADEVLFRGDVNKGEFVAFWMGAGRVLAGMNVNVWDVTEEIAALVLSESVVDPVRLADPDVPLSKIRTELVKGADV